MRRRPIRPLRRWAASVAVLAMLVTACGGGATDASGDGGTASSQIFIDGSSTVFPVTQLAAELFGEENPGVRISVGVSGTGGGFEKFCNGEIDIADASRPIKASEAEACAANGVEYIEIPVAFDGLSVLVNPENDWADCLTLEELRRIWAPEAEGVVTRWSDVRPEWPEEPLELYGPGTDSGTFDYFTEVVNGEEGVIRRDYLPSEDDNVLVQGIAGSRDALGFFGYAYYVQNQDKLKLVAVDGGGGCVLPSHDTIASGEYTPLSRPLYVYVRTDALQRPEVYDFMTFFLENAARIAADPNVGYVALPAERYEESLQRIEEARS